MSSKVFGIGLSRTGTKSLAVALNLMGIRTKWYPQDYRTYCELLMGDYRLTVLQQYDGLTDTPVVPYYAQFDDLYPGSKFVLTVRDKHAWLSSCQRHWANSGITRPEPADAPFWRQFAQWIDSVVYGSYRFNPHRWSYVYDQHLHNVTRYFTDRPDDLLVLDVSDATAPRRLSEFLGREPFTGPFPKVNDFQSPLLG